MMLKRQRLERQLDNLQSEWDVRTSKLARLRKDLAIETNGAIKFQLEQQIQTEEEEIARLESQLIKIEQDLSCETVSSTSQKSSQVDFKHKSRLSVEALYAQAHQLSVAGRWQDVIELVEQIKTLDAGYPDSRGLLLSAQRELKLSALYDRATSFEARGDRQTALQALQEIRQLRKGYRDTEARIAKLSKPFSIQPSSTPSSFLLKLLAAWSICWVIVAIVTYWFLGEQSSNASLVLLMTIFGFVGGAVSSLVKQLVIVQTASLKLKRVGLWAGLDAGIWMLIGWIASPAKIDIPAPFIAAAMSFVSNISWQLLQPNSQRKSR